MNIFLRLAAKLAFGGLVPSASNVIEKRPVVRANLG
jgi:hypothetical protein